MTQKSFTNERLSKHLHHNISGNDDRCFTETIRQRKLIITFFKQISYTCIILIQVYITPVLPQVYYTCTTCASHQYYYLDTNILHLYYVDSSIHIRPISDYEHFQRLDSRNELYVP